MSIICVTGHRPDKIYGYDLLDNRYTILKDKLKQLLIDNECTEAISGMALGVDTIFAIAVLELRNEGYNIKLHCAIPCKNHSSQWNAKAIKLYEIIIKMADIVTLVTDEFYKPYLMQKRNEFMVNKSDKIIAVWNGSNGGTKNCIDYAIKQNKEIIKIQPFEL